MLDYGRYLLYSLSWLSSREILWIKKISGGQTDIQVKTLLVVIILFFESLNSAVFNENDVKSQCLSSYRKSRNLYRISVLYCFAPVAQLKFVGPRVSLYTRTDPYPTMTSSKLEWQFQILNVTKFYQTERTKDLSMHKAFEDNWCSSAKEWNISFS